MPNKNEVKKLIHKYIDDNFDSMSDTQLAKLAGGADAEPMPEDDGYSSPSFEKWLSDNPRLVNTLRDRFGS